MKSQVSEKKEGLEEIVQLHMFVYLIVIESKPKIDRGMHNHWWTQEDETDA